MSNNDSSGRRDHSLQSGSPTPVTARSRHKPSLVLRGKCVLPPHTEVISPITLGSSSFLSQLSVCCGLLFTVSLRWGWGHTGVTHFFISLLLTKGHLSPRTPPLCPAPSLWPWILLMGFLAISQGQFVSEGDQSFVTTKCDF